MSKTPLALLVAAVALAACMEPPPSAAGTHEIVEPGTADCSEVDDWIDLLRPEITVVLDVVVMRVSPRYSQRSQPMNEDARVLVVDDETQIIRALTVNLQALGLTEKRSDSHQPSGGIVEVLASNRGKLVTQVQLLRDVWGPSYGQETNYLRVFMAQIRRTLEPGPEDSAGKTRTFRPAAHPGNLYPGNDRRRPVSGKQTRSPIHGTSRRPSRLLQIFYVAVDRS